MFNGQANTHSYDTRVVDQKIKKIDALILTNGRYCHNSQLVNHQTLL